MTDAYIETTTLTDLLLKKDGSEKAAARAINLFSRPIIPQFAWKEFKRGPLAHFIWFHNKLIVTKDFGRALSALQRLSRTPQRYMVSTAIHAAHTGFTSRFANKDLEALQKIHGEKATIGVIVTDAMQLELKRVIFQAWKKRRTLHGGWANKLDCYPDFELVEKTSLINLAPRDCPSNSDCCLRSRLIRDKAKLTAVWRSLSSSPASAKQEWVNRKKVLRDIEKRPHSSIGPKECRRIGDAYFVLTCPPDATIITTNIVDIQPMADAIGIAYQRPVNLSE
jgi:hypothetical protein